MASENPRNKRFVSLVVPVVTLRRFLFGFDSGVIIVGLTRC
ncbi:hypothetical protein [Erythrobacter sp. F6033]|nr:hypothetical protein [Erythrobacter sp. F6033]